LADGFTFLEDLVNQSVDLLDANAIHERLILYLANNFNLILRSNDPTLWRRQIKSAIPLFKQKGTLIGLQQALAQAAITFNSWTQLWQITSPYTWQEGFTVTEDQTEFELAKVVYDLTDFDLYYRADGASTYTTLVAATYAEIVYDSDDYVHLLRWKSTAPIDLEDGDIIRVIYKLRPISNPTYETYIRSLPLADQRDETQVKIRIQCSMSFALTDILIGPPLYLEKFVLNFHIVKTSTTWKNTMGHYVTPLIRVT